MVIYAMQRLTLHAIRPGDAFYIHRIGPRCTSDFPLHAHHDFHELFTVVAGSVEHELGGRRTLLGAGTVMLVRAGDAHGLGFRSADFINLNLPIAEWSRLGDYLGGAVDLGSLTAASAPPQVMLPRARHRLLVADLQRLFYRQHELDSRAALAAVLLRWLPDLAVAVPSADDAPSAPAWLPPLLTAIDDRLEQGVTIRDLPRLAGVSREHLARSLRRYHGLSPTAWLNERRLRRAELLLQRTDRGLADIAFTLGFGSLSWFHRAFHARHGCTPGAWRLSRR